MRDASVTISKNRTFVKSKKSESENRPYIADDALLSLHEAQKFLGISRSSLFALIATGAIPYSRVLPTRRRIWKSDLARYVNGNRCEKAS